MSPSSLARRASIMFAAFALGLTACGQVSLDKAGGVVPKPVVLTLANDSSDPTGVQPFATAVRHLSHGTLLIKIVGPSARLKDLHAEMPLVRDVQADKAQLGVTGTEGFDTIGISSFDALQAPFLIDSYALQRKVMRSDIARQMLAGLKPIGLVGVGLLPSGLARPFSKSRPLLGAATYQGAKIGILIPALVEEETFQALGAIPDTGRSGLTGFETDVEAADIARTAPGATLTGNVILWPWPGVIFMNRRAFDSLTAAQRSVIHRAAAQAVGEPPFFGKDTEYGRDLCRRKKIVTASSADLAGLQMAVQPVYQKLEANPSSKVFIGQIMSLRQAMGVPPDWVSCASTRRAPPSTTTANQLEGTWQVTYTKHDLIAAGADEVEIYIQDGNWGHFSLKLSSGHWWLRLIGGDPGVDSNQLSESGTYTVTSDTILFRRFDRAYPGSDTEVWGPYIWSVYRDTLTFKKAGTTPMPTDLVVKPWLKVTP
jgi:TRAP-type C4-dicarboxylate transport system substrate-binding protein